MKSDFESIELPSFQVHNSWFTFDPIRGCPAACQYCFLCIDNLNRIRPKQIVPPHDAARLLMNRQELDLTNAPVAIGNETDIFMNPASTKYLVELATHLSNLDFKKTICLISKAIMDQEYILNSLHKLAKLDNLNFVFYFSQSFAKDSADKEVYAIEKGYIASSKDTFRNAEIIDSLTPWRSIHFWRPFLYRLNPVDQIRDRIHLLHESHISSSVIVGHKRFHQRLSTSKIMSNIESSDDTSRLYGTEVFFEEGYNLARHIASSIGYPLFLSTSCSYSYLEGKPDLIGTYHRDDPTRYCAVSVCPQNQRELCNSQRLADHNQDLSNIISRLNIANEISKERGYRDRFRIDADISESTYSMLRQATHSPIAVTGEIIPDKAWLGAFSASAANFETASLLNMRPDDRIGDYDLLRTIRRLQYVTGFATCISPNSDDSRPRVFCRFDHVQRVSWLAVLLAQYFGADINETLLYTWTHDCNRWAFAHNSELGIFSQLDNCGDYFSRFEDIFPGLSDSLCKFHSRALSTSSLPLRCAIVADMCTGAIEDPLMTVTGLNIVPDFVSTFPSQLMNWADSSTDLLKSCCYSLHKDNDCDAFRALFAELFIRTTKRLFDSELTQVQNSDILFHLAEQTIAFQKGILVPHIYPINNGIVSHSHSIRTVVREMVQKLGYEQTCDIMLTHDDYTLIDYLKKMTFLDPPIEDRPFAKGPDIDGVANRTGLSTLI